MTVERSDKIKLPTWLVIFLLPLIVSLITTLTVYAFSSGKQTKQVEVNTQEIEKKVDKEVFDLLLDKINTIEESQIRVEKKLDNHISDR